MGCLRMENEQRLIDANAFAEALENADADVCETYHDCYCDWGFSRKAIEDIVDRIPTVDAVEVIHGEWLVEAYTADDSIVVIPYRKHQHNEPFCSRCGHYALLNGCGDYVTSNYCPHCGAKMDGGNEDVV